MFIYEAEGFLEVESKDIIQLCRSTVAVPLCDPVDGEPALHAVLCLSSKNSEQRCLVAFYSSETKKALVFAVKGPEQQAAWQHGQGLLVQLGFQLEDVNLKLSPAMLEVVLRDVPGLLSPADAQKRRTEKARSLTELQEACDENPDSAQAKKAVLKLNTEKRLVARLEQMRQQLESLFSPETASGGDVKALVSQNRDLTERLKAVEGLVETERTQREMSEAITRAAEKRIQELEETLVDFETKSSKALKQSQKNVQLQGRIKALENTLAEVEADLDTEREKQGQFIDDVKKSHDRMTQQEKALKVAERALEKSCEQRAEILSEKTELDGSLQESNLRILALDRQLKVAEHKLFCHEEQLQTEQAVQTQLAETESALQKALRLNGVLEEQLAEAEELKERQASDLLQAESAVSDRTDEQEQLTSLREQVDQITAALDKLREEYEQECSIRKRLEKSSVAEDRRITELEEALADARATPVVEDAEGVDDEVDLLKKALLDETKKLKKEQRLREGLEAENKETHKLIDSLEKMVRETEAASGEKLSGKDTSLDESLKLQELDQKLKAAEAQLEQERLEQKKLAKQLVSAETRLAKQVGSQAAPVMTEKPVSQAPAKALPHELKPAPKKGALFRPDWDRECLPCSSSSEVYKVWETVFNVQISLEGYPSQYCMAFLVVLRLKKQKQLFMLYRLKKSNHTLVCVPVKSPKDEASMKKAIKGGLDYLRKSGFDMQEMATENVDSTLGRYFMKG